jgi:hypothetical protein
VLRIPASLLAALALALGLVACGGDDVEQSNDYVEAVNAAQTSFAQTFDKLQSEITTESTPKEDSATLGRFEGAIDDVVQDLSAVKPPEAVKALHQQLIDAIEGYGTTIAKAREAFRSSSPSEVLSARTQLSTDVARTSTRINQTIDAINRKLRE